MNEIITVRYLNNSDDDELLLVEDVVDEFRCDIAAVLSPENIFDKIHTLKKCPVLSFSIFSTEKILKF